MTARKVSRPIAFRGETGTKLVADRIRAVREDLGLNQTEFAAELRLSRSHLSDIETRKVKITVDTIFAVAEAFGERTRLALLHVLLTGVDNPVPWGEYPGSSPLNAVLGRDRRASLAAFGVIEVWERREGRSFTKETREELYGQTLLKYVSVLVQAEAEGLEPADARACAERACEAMAGGLDLA